MNTTFAIILVLWTSTAHSGSIIIPQPSMDVCNHNGEVFTSTKDGWMTPRPYNYFKCIDTTKKYELGFKWYDN